MVHRRSLSVVLAEVTPRWMAISGVAGTSEGIHQHDPCLVVRVSKSPDEFAGTFPATLEGYPVVVREVGKLYAYPVAQVEG